MCSRRLSIGIAKHLCRNELIWGTYLTPDGYAQVYHTQTIESTKCSSSCFKFGEFIDKDYIAMLLLLTLSSSRKQVQRYEEKMKWQKLFLAVSG